MSALPSDHAGQSGNEPLYASLMRRWSRAKPGLISAGSKQISADVVFATISQILGRGSLIFASILIANFMTAENFSTFSYFNLTVSMIAAYSTLGLGAAAARIFAESTVSLSPAKQGELRAVLVLAFLSACLAVLIIQFLPPGLLSANVNLDKPVLYASIIAITMNSVLMGAATGRGAFRRMALAAVIGMIVLFLGVCFAVGLANINIAIWSVLASMLVQIGIFAAFLAPILGWRPGNGVQLFQPHKAANVLKLAGPMFLMSILIGTVFWLLGRIVVGGENGAVEFSKFAIGLQWFSFILLIPSIITRVMFPRIVRAVLSDNGGGRKLALANAGVNFLIASMLGALTIAFGNSLMALYGSASIANVEVFRIFVLAAVVASPVNGIGSVIIARDPGPRHWLMLQIGWCLVAVFGVLQFAPDDPAASAGWALLYAYLCLAPASLLVLSRMKLI